MDKASARERLASTFYHHKIQVSRGLHAVERTRMLFALALKYPQPTQPGDYGVRANLKSGRDKLPASLLFFHGTARAEKLWPEDRWIELGRPRSEICCVDGQLQEDDQTDDHPDTRESEPPVVAPPTTDRDAGHRRDHRAQIHSHVEDRVAGVSPCVVGPVQPADDRRHVGLEESVSDDEQGQREIEHVDLLDGVIRVGKDEAYDYTRRCAKEEAILVGLSTGAVLAAVAKKIPDLPEGSRILTFCYDTGERYLSVEDLF